MAFKNKEISNPATGQSIRFLQTSKDTAGILLEMESTFRPKSIEPQAHYHPYQEEDFLVIEGQLNVRINGERKIFRRGDRLHVPKNVVHSMWNDSGTKTILNWRVTPALNTEYLLETAMGLAQDGKTDNTGKPGLLQAALMMNSFTHVFRLAKPSFPVQKIVFSILGPIGYLFGYRSVYRQYLD